jgi:hypothetical protein
MDFRTWQTSTASPAGPGGLLRRTRSLWFPSKAMVPRKTSDVNCSGE